MRAKPLLLSYVEERVEESTESFAYDNFKALNTICSDKFQGEVFVLTCRSAAQLITKTKTGNEQDDDTAHLLFFSYDVI